MRLLPYLILAYVAIGLQVGAADFARVGGVPPNVVLLAVIFIAVNAPREAALLGCFGIGLLWDLTTMQPLGLGAVSFGLVGLFVSGVREIVYRGHPLTHVALGLFAGLLVAAVQAAHGLVALAIGRGPAAPAGALVGTAVYTAALAPIVLGLLQKIRRAFAFQPPRRRARHW